MSLVKFFYDLGGALVAVGAILAAIRWLFRSVRPFFKSIRGFLSDWHGEPAREGVAARPGVMVRISNLEDTTQFLKQEVSPNHGQSLKDMVTRVETKVALIESRQQEDRNG